LSNRNPNQNSFLRELNTPQLDEETILSLISGKNENLKVCLYFIERYYEARLNAQFFMVQQLVGLVMRHRYKLKNEKYSGRNEY